MEGLGCAVGLGWHASNMVFMLCADFVVKVDPNPKVPQHQSFFWVPGAASLSIPPLSHAPERGNRIQSRIKQSGVLLAGPGHGIVWRLWGLCPERRGMHLEFRAKGDEVRLVEGRDQG